MLFAALASGLWIINSLYSIGYMRGNREQHQTRFYVMFAVSLAATMGVAFAGNLFTLFLFYEALTLSTYPLVSHKGDDKTVRSARVYLGILLTTSIGLFLPAIIWTYAAAGSGDFTPQGILSGNIEGPAVGLLLGLFVFGVGKAAVMPVHRWLPAAMVAPTPVSALLHAVAVVKAGVFTVTKIIVYIFGVDFLFAEASSGWLLYAGAFTIIAASVVALRQQNLKRLLAYSTVAQLSYVVMAAAILKPLAEIGAAVHIVAHAFRQDHAVLRGRRDLHGGEEDGAASAARHRPAHAGDDDRLHDRRAQHDRRTADRRFRLQVVHTGRGIRSGQLRRAADDRSQHGAQRSLLPADRLRRLVHGGGAG